MDFKDMLRKGVLIGFEKCVRESIEFSTKGHLQ